MNWQVEFLDSAEEQFESLPISNEFRLKLIDYVLAKLENESTHTLKSSPCLAPVFGYRLWFNLCDEHNEWWRFGVFYGESSSTSTRKIQDVDFRKLDTSSY